MNDITLSVCDSLEKISIEEWENCANPPSKPYNPFLSYHFLRALETSRSVGKGTGWYPYYIVAHENNRLIGALPSYLKTHSQGEYIFDHSWAHAYEQAGGQYFPKLQIAAPFTPATGRRILLADGTSFEVAQYLIETAKDIALKNGFSSLHITFCQKDEYERADTLQLLQRYSTQFHWINQNYKNFDDFLNNLSSRKRKTIKRERRDAHSFGGEIITLRGDEIKPHHWDYFWAFYQDTGARKWGQPYLTRRFFTEISEKAPDDLLLILAVKEERPIAGALNFIGGEALFGRYWGALEHHPFLHFEVCYYRAIDYAIENNLARVEAGAQGEHKLARGYMPSETYSLHWMADQGFHHAIEQYLHQERQAVHRDIDILTSYGPFKCIAVEEHD